MKSRPLWQLLSGDPSELTCEECFAVMEYYAHALAECGPDILPRVLEHLRTCPDCRVQHREALRRLTPDQPEDNRASGSDPRESGGSDVEES